MGLAEPYVRFRQTLESEIKFRKHTRNGCILVKATCFKSRYSPTAREVYLLFKGNPLATTDTFCTCHVGARMDRAFILLGQLIGNIESLEVSRTELMLKRGLVLYRDNEISRNIRDNIESSDSEGESMSESESGS